MEESESDSTTEDPNPNLIGSENQDLILIILVPLFSLILLSILIYLCFFTSFFSKYLPASCKCCKNNNYCRRHKTDCERGGGRGRGLEGEDSSPEISTDSTFTTEEEDANPPPSGNPAHPRRPRPQNVNSPTTTIETESEVEVEVEAETEARNLDVNLTQVRVDLNIPRPGSSSRSRATHAHIDIEPSEEEEEEEPESKPEPDPDRIRFNSKNNKNKNINNNNRLRRSPINTKGGIILGVDATPRNCGGYCVRKGLDVCEFYSIGKERLPWKYHNLSRRGNSAEFEMKNLMYALLNWEGLIVESGKLWLYTDNMAIRQRGTGSAHGSTVRAYLNHLKTCHAVRIMNDKNHHVHRHKSPETFLKYIEPADHLSRRHMADFYEHMQSHFPQITYFVRDDDFSKVEDQMDRWVQKRCPTCGFRIRETASLRETIRRRANLKVLK